MIITGKSDAPPFEFSREEVLFEIKRRKRFDLVIVGGGIHGAALARIASLNGLSVLLCEKNDYASQTSSRSSKMAHGGLRYLELLDFAQVFEGIKAREELFAAAPHIIRPTQFIIPTSSKKLSDSFYKWKIKVGLTLYDLFLKEKSRKHSFVNGVTGLPAFPNGEDGHFLYTDGIMNDTRVVIETILAARQEGALCLNYFEVKSLAQGSGGENIIGVVDRVTGESYEVRAGAVANCAGPHVARIGRLNPSSIESEIKYSQGSHLLFNFEWKYPPIFLPIEKNTSRYYWVWPHEHGTLVGTNEYEVDGPIENPLPRREEIEELLSRVKRDLPEEPFSKELIHYAFAGIRTLPKVGNSKSAKLSRRHKFHFERGVLTLIGGKFTTANWTALEMLKMIWKESKVPGSPIGVGDRALPGGVITNSLSDEVAEKLSQAGLQGHHARLMNHWGRRADKVASAKNLSESYNKILNSEIHLAINEEQAICAADVVSRRLSTIYQPKIDLNLLFQIIAQNATGKNMEPFKSRFSEEQNQSAIAQYNEVKKLCDYL